MMINCIHNQRRFFAGLVVFLGLSCLPLSLKASQWGDWTYTSDGSNITITGYTGTNGDIIIPDMISNMTVVAIGTIAFGNHFGLTNVTLPHCITNIGASAFFFCTNLTSVTVGSGVTIIGLWAFKNCINLQEVFFGGNAPKAGYDIFVNDLGFSFVIVYYLQGTTGWGERYGDRVTLMWNHRNGEYICFTNVSAVTITRYTGESGNVVIPSAIERLPVTVIGNFAFCSRHNLTNVLFPESVTNIGNWGFADTSLTTITIPNGVASIGAQAFWGCQKMTDIVIPSSVMNIGSNAFACCFSMASAYFKGDPPAFSSTIYDSDDNLISYYYPWTTGWTDTYGGRPTQVNPAYTQWLLNNNFATNGIEATTNDFDEDGMLNWQEYLSGTSPTNDADRLAISSMGSGSNSLISWLAKSNVSYQVMRCSDLLGIWENAVSGAETNQQSQQTATLDQILQYMDPGYAGDTTTFYRVNVVP